MELFRYCDPETSCSKCRMNDENGRVVLTRPSAKAKAKAKMKAKAVSQKPIGTTWSLFKDQIDNFLKKLTEDQIQQLRELLKTDEQVLLCTYPGKIGTLYHGSEHGKNHGSTIVGTSFGRLMKVSMYGNDSREWSVCSIENPYVPDDKITIPLSPEYVSLMSLLTFRSEQDNYGGYDMDMYHRFVHEYYYQNKLVLADIQDRNAFIIVPQDDPNPVIHNKSRSIFDYIGFGK